MLSRRLAIIIMSWRRLGRQKNVTLKTSSVRFHQDECLLGFNYINFSSTFLSKGTSFVTTESYVPHTTCKEQITNHSLDWSGYVTATPAIAHQGWMERSFLAFCNLTEAFKNNTLYLTFTFQRPSNSNNNNSLLLDVFWKVKCDNMV